MVSVRHPSLRLPRQFCAALVKGRVGCCSYEIYCTLDIHLLMLCTVRNNTCIMRVGVETWSDEGCLKNGESEKNRGKCDISEENHLKNSSENRETAFQCSTMSCD